MLSTSPPTPAADEAVPPQRPSADDDRSKAIVAGLLGLVLMVAAVLRLSGLNWDQGHNQHPDERFIVMVTEALEIPQRPLQFFDTARSTLNPYNQGFDGFAYGTLPVFIVKALAVLVQPRGFEGMTLLGRTVSALFDLGTVFLVFLIGAQAYGRWVGLLASAFSALAVLQIQLAHFYTVDSFLAFFTAFTLLFAYRTWLGGRWSDAALMGLGLGLAEATKISGILLLPIVLLACVVPSEGRRPLERGGWFGPLALSLCVAFIAFRFAEPYAFTGPSPLGIRPNMQFVDDISKWVRISSGEIEVPYMVQWARTRAYLDPLRWLVLWGLGPGLGVAALGGLLFAAVDLRRGVSARRSLLLVAWSVLCLAYFGGQFAKFLRYLVPVYPALAVLAAFGLLRLARASERITIFPPRIARLVGMLPVIAVLLVTSWYAAAFTTLYTRPHSRMVASEWIYDTIPAGTTLATEHWDDRLPLNLGRGDPEQYRYVSLDLYDEETPAKAEKMAAALDSADYVVLASYRLSGSIPRLPERYPLATSYYRWLFAGQLGFEQVAELQQRPSFLGLSVDDSKAPEDLTVYEHPTVTIFRKTDGYSAQQTAELLGSVNTEQAIKVAPLRAGAGTLMLSESERSAVGSAGTWRELFPRESAANQVPLLAWLLALEVFGIVVFPLIWRLLPHIPDRGWAVAKTLALVGCAYVAWLLQSLGIAPFGTWTLLLGLLLMTGTSAIVLRRSSKEFFGWLSRNRAQLACAEAVFLVAFGGMLALRLANPDLWHSNFGGEKPMDFAYFNAVLKSAVFPPYDPWFAGGYVNYYYYGFVLAAVPTKLLGIVPAIAYNLLIPTFFALLCSASFGFVGALVLARPALARREGRALSIVAGLAAVFLVAVLGDLDGLLQLVQGLSALAPASAGSALPGLSPIMRVFAGLPAWLMGADLPQFDFWRPTRVIGPEDPGPITEFPFFTFLYGDLHAHLLALPVTVTVLVVALNAARTRRDLGSLHFQRDLPRRLLPILPSVILLGLLIGTLRATNTWDFPIYFLVAGLGVTLAVRPRDWRRWHEFAAPALALVGGIYVLAALLFAPYLRHYQLFYTGFNPAPADTAIGQMLTIHGVNLFLVMSAIGLEVLLIYAARRALSSWPRAAGEPTYGLALPAPPLALPSSAAGALALGLAGLAAGFYLVGGRSAALLVACVAVLPLLLARRRWNGSALLALGGVALGLLALLLPELIALQGDVGRMNTVFKFHLQAWVLLALTGAAGAAYVARRARRLQPSLAGWRDGWSVLLVLLTCGAAIYPLLATPVKIGLRFDGAPAATLDGMAYMCCAQYKDRDLDLDLPSDRRALLWIQDHIDGTPVIAEGNAGLYRWGSRVSIYTGLPTIIGWDWHQKQQRWAYQSTIDDRLRDVRVLYESSAMDAAWPVLERYGVEYVYVGGLERAYYPADGLAKFEGAVGSGLERVYDADGVRIYHLTPRGES